MVPNVFDHADRNVQFSLFVTNSLPTTLTTNLRLAYYDVNSYYSLLIRIRQVEAMRHIKGWKHMMLLLKKIVTNWASDVMIKSHFNLQLCMCRLGDIHSKYRIYVSSYLWRHFFLCPIEYINLFGPLQ